jgi:cytochrome c55X
MTRTALLITSFIFITAQAVAAELDSSRQNELLYLLKHDCGSCHGMTLKGGLGPSLLPEALSDKPAGLLVSTILDGRPNTAMPPWKNMLTQDEAEWLTAQLLRGVQ